ncbi:conserved hypothetical protein [Candidatus Accumulibacter aalborgensis]|uniref:Putative restriction endonuclease domain-containing protein n=1 Tax=Candidatus Accumulibacter aalborgensis TaxID=1860102 RepID=A0A1A8Y1G7_9PROT|nr:Uma2 family endonuclease [Candidatus Accumulibacter aalborgensis]SBT10223.1 conserved hypothetical protein [Candidatus Accumulibacter aalborgensis]
MNLPAERSKMSLAEFMTWEAQQAEKYELHAGEVYRHEVYGMVGARRTHVIAAGNCFAALKERLRGGPCQAFISDMKVLVDQDHSYYPDVLVTCHPEDLAADLAMRHPKVIIEVLSPATANYDRGDKFLAYRKLPSLEEYALIDPSSHQIEVYRRQANDDWLLVTSDSPRGLVLNSLGIQIALEVVFEDLGGQEH